MEAIEEPSVHSTIDNVKINVVDDGTGVVSVEADLCHRSNGVAEAVSAGYATSASAPEMKTHSVAAIPDTEVALANSNVMDSSTDSIACLPPESEILAVIETTTAVENLLGNNSSTTEETEGSQTLCNEREIPVEESTVEVCTVDTANDKVTFETEILVEKNDNNHDQVDFVVVDHDNANNILSELGQGIELSEVLRSSDTTDNVENNNSGRQEMFNKEELLDILEGNDVESTGKHVTVLLQSKDPDTKKILEAQIAMKQLSRLKKKRQTKRKRTLESNRNRSKSFERPPRKKRETKTLEITTDTVENIDTANENTNALEQNTASENKCLSLATEENCNTAEKKQSHSIVNVLVKDWDDDEPAESDKPDKSLENIADEQPINAQITVTSQEDDVNIPSANSPTCEDQNTSLNKSTDEGQPQRRLGRVIKKKVIFDPDNPDTFTKGKVVTKTKEPQAEKEQTPTKKNKVDEKQTPKSKPPIEKQRPKSKSPVAKMAWKKPSPRNSNKQNKRLTEVDKLLMDEGAVNMIYQLTPEGPQGMTKNMKTKAEFIKKIQSSTPDGKEMKFRERKKESIKSEEEAKKISGGKPRSSLSGSVQSSSVCEDFETHSADDSIIYRRHSSSSYSSTCMSPRRLSDVDASAAQGASKVSQQPSETQTQALEGRNGDQDADVFMADASNASSNEVINKDDCLSIKEKLNSKLSLALNKRKRESSKGDKPSKQKKVLKAEIKDESAKAGSIGSFKYLSISFDQRLAEICIRKTGTKAGLVLIKELEQALAYVDSRKDTSVTLITSECGTLCSDLDLAPLLDDNMERRTNYAFGIAESVRCLLCSASRHSKMLVSGVWGACAGVALALVALSDVTLASERATFGVGPAAGAAPPLPSTTALAARCRQMPQSLLNELVVFGRRVSAAEAQRGGLVSRTVWPDRAAGQVRAIAGDIAAQPMQSVLLKKQLLSLGNGGDAESTFLTSLEKERDLLVQYWTSVEGQEVVRASLDAS